MAIYSKQTIPSAAEALPGPGTASLSDWTTFCTWTVTSGSVS
ncbi:hypothetical protein [Endozoicomonas lisbonensis]